MHLAEKFFENFQVFLFKIPGKIREFLMQLWNKLEREQTIYYKLVEERILRDSSSMSILSYKKSTGTAIITFSTENLHNTTVHYRFSVLNIVVNIGIQE